MDANSHRVVISASFTADPVQDGLEFWMELLGLPVSIEFAPYDQVYQQLLDPASVLARNRYGLNVVLLRPEDWLRRLPASAGHAPSELEEVLERNVTEFVQAVHAMAARSEVALIVALCPGSPAVGGEEERSRELQRASIQVAEALRDAPGVSLVTQRDFDLYPVAESYDARRDRLAHIPYTSEFFATIATVLARRIHEHLAPPHKVVVLDCDNTLWQGVVGEDGVEGIRISPAFQALQRFMVELSERGLLLCLCSRNVEADVLQVLTERSDMILRKEHLVSWRINWRPKWENIRSLSQELNLGLDSFVFLDDNPLECAELGLACPEVLSLRVPPERDIEPFLRHLWAFDRTRVTLEDRQRTAMYQQEFQRARLQREAPTLAEFVSGLELQVTIEPPTAEQVARVAQLTQRTNQFNFTTVRRTDGEIRRLADSALECRAIEVRDRFGDYGLVGVMIFATRDEALVVDTFLLSCRVLGRGVEHRMLRELGQIAQERNLARVTVPLLFTTRNQPARDFMERIAPAQGIEIEGGMRYELATDFAAELVYQPYLERADTKNAGQELGQEQASSKPRAAPAAALEGGIAAKSRRHERISCELRRPEQVWAAVRARAARKSRPDAAGPLAPARTALESQLIEIWSEVLRVAPIGIHDSFFDLGGTSMLSVDLCAQIEQRLGKVLPLTSIMEAPTVAALARRIAAQDAHESLVLIRPGAGRPTIFLVHDGDGETLLYRNLALRLHRGHAVYGLQPHSVHDAPMVHTRIPEMAAYYIEQIRTVQPQGPYVLGGMCAGGVIAFEIALQLRAQGEEISLVALLDAADPAAAPRAWKRTQERVRRSIAVFGEARSGGSAALRAWTIAATLLKKARNLSVYVLKHRAKRIWDDVRVRLFRAALQRGRRPPPIVGEVSVRTAYLFAERSYRPSGALDAQLVLFRATRGAGDDEPYIERYEDPLLGWGPRTVRRLRTVDVPGGHSSMLREPHVEALAELMQRELDRVLAEESKPAAARIA